MLAYADLHGVDLRETAVWATDFRGADLRDALFRESDLPFIHGYTDASRNVSADA